MEYLLKSNVLSLFISIFISQVALAQRARDPWIFRSVLDNTPRAINFAFHKNLWASYDTERCRLIKLWNGDIDFQGEVYNGVKAIQPMHTGKVYIADEKDSINCIMIFENGKWQKPAKIKFISYKVLNNRATMQYEIQTSSGGKAVVEESPEYWVNAVGEGGFQRIWNIKSNPSLIKIGTKVLIPEMSSAKSFETNGVFEIIEKAEKYVDNRTIFSTQVIILFQATKPTELTHYFAK